MQTGKHIKFICQGLKYKTIINLQKNAISSKLEMTSNTQGFSTFNTDIENDHSIVRSRSHRQKHTINSQSASYLVSTSTPVFPHMRRGILAPLIDTVAAF
jgi:hypothetical protein